MPLPWRPLAVQVQKLLARLIACVPEGSAQNNPIVIQSCIMVRCRSGTGWCVLCGGLKGCGIGSAHHAPAHEAVPIACGAHCVFNATSSSCGSTQLAAAASGQRRPHAQLPPCARSTRCPALSSAQVLKELRAVYRCVCEGVINLADKFFEMDRADALKGLDLYKENVALNDKLNTFFQAVANIPALRGTVQLPNLQVRAGVRGWVGGRAGGRVCVSKKAGYSCSDVKTRDGSHVPGLHRLVTQHRMCPPPPLCSPLFPS